MVRFPSGGSGVKLKRLSFIIGLAIGYVLGAKAGRERYEQIRKFAGRVAETDTARQLIEKGSAVADLGAARAKQVVSEGMSTAADKIREKTEG
ncbi:MAG: YtxH domain-containing protein [Acidimicrobiia bacterium]|nr:YtxH domain-containing protein [Acidimicrobiia bacterium]